jgi:hypothetical protein
MIKWIEARIDEIDHLYHLPDFDPEFYHVRPARIIEQAILRMVGQPLPQLPDGSLPDAIRFLSECQSGFLDLRGAAEYMGRSESGLRKLVSSHRIRFQQFGKNGRIYFRREWLDDVQPAETNGAGARRAKIKPRDGFDPNLLSL